MSTDRQTKAIHAIMMGGGGSGGLSSGSVSTSQTNCGSTGVRKVHHTEITVLGYMHKYNIPREKYDEVLDFICLKIGKDMLLYAETRAYSPHAMLIDICENDLPTFKFNNELEDVLDGSND